MTSMFENAKSFNQDLTMWFVKIIITKEHDFLILVYRI